MDKDGSYKLLSLTNDFLRDTDNFLVSQDPVILEVTDKKVTMERSFMCFSGMERSAKQIGENKYELRLHYYLLKKKI